MTYHWYQIHLSTWIHLPITNPYLSCENCSSNIFIEKTNWGILPKLIKTGIMEGWCDDFHQMKEHPTTLPNQNGTCNVHVHNFIFIHVLPTLVFSFLLEPDNRNSFILSRFACGPKKPFRRRSLPPSPSHLRSLVRLRVLRICVWPQIHPKTKKLVWSDDHGHTAN